MYRFFGLFFSLLVVDFDLGRFRIRCEDLHSHVIVFCYCVLGARDVVVVLVDGFATSLFAIGFHCDYIFFVLALNDVLSQASCMEPYTTSLVAALDDEMVGVLWSFAFTYQTQRLSRVSTTLKDATSNT